MRINWFSPLPSARTEIANYTARLVPALSELCEVTLWTDQPASSLALEIPGDVRHFRCDQPPWAKLNQATVNVYHIGNNAQWHSGIWRVSRRQPGLIVLHETHLAHLFLGMCHEVDDCIRFIYEVAGHFGKDGLHSITRFRDGNTSIESLSEQLPLTELATTNALGILVHNRDVFERLQHTSSVPVMCASLPHEPRVARPEPTAHLRKYNRAERYRLVLFGHLGVNRRLDVVLRSLASFAARHRFQLDVYGNVDQRDGIFELVHELSLESLVRIHGFVPESTLTTALEKAHLAINLRFPTMGEASASQLRIWDHALPSAVTPVGWYAHLSPDAVNFVRPDHETADLHAILDAFLQNPSRFAAQGLVGRSILERCHSVHTYAKDVAAFASACGQNRGRVALRGVAWRSAAELVRTAGPRGAAIGFEALTDQVLALRGTQQ